MAVTELLRQTLEQKIPIESAFESSEFSQFLPITFKKNAYFFKTFKKSEIQKSLITAWNNSNGNIEHVKQGFINSFTNELVDDYGIEKYRVKYLDQTLPEVELQVEPLQENGISFRYVGDSRNLRVKICSIEDLCFVSIQNANQMVEISRRNGIPNNFQFSNSLKLKSFVSLLDGYYRLGEKWTFNICKDISSPSLQFLRSIKCHGPVGFQFSNEKLREKGSSKNGVYLLRESIKKYDSYKLDVICSDNQFQSFEILRNANGDYTVADIRGLTFRSINDIISSNKLLSESKQPIDFRTCLPPSEYDQPGNLLICKKQQNTQVKKSTEIESIWPIVIPIAQLKLTNTIWTDSPRYCVRLAELGNQQVVIKQNKQDSQATSFLKSVSEWIYIRNDSIVQCKGITLHSPLGLVMEYLPFGPLDAFLMAHQKNLKYVDLIESVTYVARALWYLNENNMVHGRIRCHNLFVVNYASNSLKVKLGDPISDIILHHDTPWLPPEYLDRTVPEITSAFDVWSFATTLWQIFNFGVKPDNDNVDLLIQPSSCPFDMWSLICECWTKEAALRKQPQSIIRDVSQILYEVYNTRCTVNGYSSLVYNNNSKVTQESEVPTKLKKIRSTLFGSTQSISTIHSLESTSTQITNTCTEVSYKGEDFAAFKRPILDLDNDACEEPWVIESNQLRFGKILGQVSIYYCNFFTYVYLRKSA